METTIVTKPNGTVFFTTMCENEPTALRVLIDAELTGCRNIRFSKLGDGTCMVQGECQ